MIASILVVDDSDVIRGMLRVLLEEAHHRVIEATDGAQAFAMAEEHHPHLIIMDVVMPGLYGTTAAKKLHEYRSTANIPIIIFSGTADEKIFEKIGLKDDKNIAFLHKPSNAKEILETVRKMLPEGGYTR